MKIIIGSIIIAVLITKILEHYTPYDSTDNPPQRSGMKIYTDNLTGCQYLARPFSELTPRLDSTGKQICRRSL